MAEDPVVTGARAMIFHVPFPLRREAATGSGIRPVQLRRAFEELGWQVWEISGTAAQRAAAFRRVRAAVRSGVRFEFVYSESSTLPNTFAGPSRRPHAFLEARIFAFCRRRGIPVGVFYRDIYWHGGPLGSGRQLAVNLLFRAAYRYDLLVYRLLVKRLFVPSIAMAEKMPWTRRQQCVALPPAADPVDSPVPTGPPNLFYVGGLGPYYRLTECVAAVGDRPEISMTVCTPPELWERHHADYEPLPANVEIVHASGAGLQEFYDRSGLGVLFLEPIAYREFAAPLKLFEYLAQGKPIIAVDGSLAGRFVTDHGVGWTLPYRREALVALLDRLTADPAEYQAARERCLAVRGENTWTARAAQAAALLGTTPPHRPESEHHP